MLFVTVQQNNLEVCIEYAVNEYVVQSSDVASTLIFLFQVCLSAFSYSGTFSLEREGYEHSSEQRKT